MVSRSSGKILNVASVYSFSLFLSNPCTARAKRSCCLFSSSLQSELKGTGVSVTVFCPGVTQTEFRSRAGIPEKRKDSGMTAEAAAHIAYTETLRGKHIVVPGFLNRIFVFLAQLLPVGSMASVVRFINRRRGQSL